MGVGTYRALLRPNEEFILKIIKQQNAEIRKILRIGGFF
jgi:hypothetical protein